MKVEILAMIVLISAVAADSVDLFSHHRFLEKVCGFRPEDYCLSYSLPEHPCTLCSTSTVCDFGGCLDSLDYLDAICGEPLEFWDDNPNCIDMGFGAYLAVTSTV